MPDIPVYGFDVIYDFDPFNSNKGFRLETTPITVPMNMNEMFKADKVIAKTRKYFSGLRNIGSWTLNYNTAVPILIPTRFEFCSVCEKKAPWFRRMTVYYMLKMRNDIHIPKFKVHTPKWPLTFTACSERCETMFELAVI